MCVIFISNEDGGRPNEEHFAQAYERNDHGGGLAWREGGTVKWKKGLDLKEMQEMLPGLPQPFVAHFRIASCGGIRPSLTHPFPIHKDAGLLLEGSYEGPVLFHNGHYPKWKDVMLDVLCKTRQKLPQGNWSDTRMFAWLSAQFGTGILDLFDEKFCVFSPAKIETFGAWHWQEKERFWASNNGWQKATLYKYPHQGIRDNTEKPVTPGSHTSAPHSILGLNEEATTESGIKPPAQAKTQARKEPSDDPFVRACRVWLEATKQHHTFTNGCRGLSKKGWKRARKQYERACKKNEDAMRTMRLTVARGEVTQQVTLH